MRMILTPRSIVVFAVSGLIAVGCGDGNDQPAGTPADEPVILASTSIWADITSNVACGLPVASLIPAGADPHSYEPSLRDRELVSGATVVVANGAGLEVTVEGLLDAAIDEGVNVVEVVTHIDLLDGGDDHDEDEREDDEHDGEDEHDHGDGDPHVWQDPTRIAGALDVIASAIAAAGLETCETEYHDELMALDVEITAILADVPAERRLLATSHDSLAYFADRYDFEIVGTVVPSTSTMGETSAGELAELTDLIEDRGVTAIFTDAFESASDAEALAERIGIDVVPLVTDALTDDADTYAELMRSNAATIATTLSP